MHFCLVRSSLEIKSSIVVCKNIDILNSYVLENYSKYNLKIFKSEEKKSDDFLIENAKEVVKEAYIAESSTKVIATIFKNYRVEAQNSLLKILEEPPKNIVFIVGVLSKSVLLPTIRSRMMIKTIKTYEEAYEFNLDLKRLDIKMIYEFLEDKKFLDKNLTKTILQSILTKSITSGIVLTSVEMQMFEKMLYLAELNSRSSYILLNALLIVLHRKNR